MTKHIVYTELVKKSKTETEWRLKTPRHKEK